METVRIRDPGWKKSRIRDKHAESATLEFNFTFLLCGLDGSLFKPREIRNWSKDDMLSYTAHRRGKPALYASRTFLRQALPHMLRKNSKR